jgi:DNA (cytosine-5)-methyltransferase 1
MHASEHLTPVLSLFPGAGLLDRGFTLAGYCVLRGPEILLGTDIADFHMPAGIVTGIIAGPPCQDFSAARRTPPSGHGLKMLEQTIRIIEEARPAWFLIENVPSVPNIAVFGYKVHRFNLMASEFGAKQRRNRAFQFGYASGPPLSIWIHVQSHFDRFHPAALASNRTSTIADLAELQGLPRTFRLPLLSRAAQARLIGNGVPIPVATAIAQAIRDRFELDGHRTCKCGCGRILYGRKIQQCFSPACRKRLQRNRDSTSTAAHSHI